jgi:hypothetical protein
VVKSRRMGLVGNVANMEGEERCKKGFGGETWKETTWKTYSQMGV